MAQLEPSLLAPAEAQALNETSCVVSSIIMVRNLGSAFLATGFVGVVAGAGVGEGAIVVVELGVPIKVGVLAVSDGFLSSLPRLAIIAQVIPAAKIINAIIKANLTVLDILAVYPPLDRNQEELLIPITNYYSSG